MKGPNGLYVEDDRVLHLTFYGGELFSIDKDTKEIAKLADGIGGGDGIVPDGKGNYLVSDWYGQLFIFDKDWNKKQILDTRDLKISAADIEYIPSANLLLVPTFLKNTVVAYELK